MEEQRVAHDAQRGAELAHRRGHDCGIDTRRVLHQDTGRYGRGTVEGY